MHRPARFGQVGWRLLDVGWLLDKLAEREARIAELEARLQRNEPRACRGTAASTGARMLDSGFCPVPAPAYAEEREPLPPNVAGDR